MMNISAIEECDVQGLVRFGHGHLKEACFLLLEVKDAVVARRWLAKQAAVITTAKKQAARPATALQVAFTSPGLEALHVPQGIIQGFSPEFISGMANDENRSRRLGDVGVNASWQWKWGGSGKTPHVLLMLYAAEGQLENWKKAITEELLVTGFSLLLSLETSSLDEHGPFGFRDGISQPTIDWDRKRPITSQDQLEYGNLVALGEFLLGYPNEYGKYTDRPLIDPKDDPNAILLPAEDQPDKKDLGRNGTYLVFRQLHQNVPGFWQFLDQQAKSDPAERQKLAEAMVGRKMEGEPRLPLAAHPIPGVDGDDVKSNQFTYEADPAGTRCPFGAHIRRSNPRNADFPSGVSGIISRLIRILGFGHQNIRDDLMASTRFHRLLRRGREYGSELKPEPAIQVGQTDDEERGIHFIALNASISRQFEFVQNAWVMSTKFDGLTEESDPLLGNREPIAGCHFTNTFSLPQENGVGRRINGLPQFVTVRGGAYFFLPSIRALRYIAKLGP